jgi:hypothetical protein
VESLCRIEEGWSSRRASNVVLHGDVGCGFCGHDGVEYAKVLESGRAELFQVGKIGTYTISDIYYYFDGSIPVAGAKAILVETGKNQVRDIFYRDNAGWPENPGATQIVGEKLPNQILAMTEALGAMGMVLDYQFWVAPGISLQLDWRGVQVGPQKPIYLDRQKTYIGPPEFGFKGGELTVHRPVRGEIPADLGPLDSTFRIDHGRVIVTGSNARKP